MNQLLLLIAVAAIVAWVSYTVGFDEGLSAGITANAGDEYSWDCTYSRVTKFAICDARPHK